MSQCYQQQPHGHSPSDALPQAHTQPSWQLVAECVSERHGTRCREFTVLITSLLCCVYVVTTFAKRYHTTQHNSAAQRSASDYSSLLLNYGGIQIILLTYTYLRVALVRAPTCYEPYRRTELGYCREATGQLNRPMGVGLQYSV